MAASRQVHHSQGRFHYSYAASLLQQLYTIVLMPLIAVFLVFLILHFYGSRPSVVSEVSAPLILLALLATFTRLLVAFCFALVLSVPIALLITHSRLTERVLLPFFDIMQSVPVLAFFPVIILLFINYGLLDAASIFIIFLSMIWNIVFPLVGGLHTIPNDIRDMARVFEIRGWHYLTKILLPALVPFLVVGSILAWAQAWNIIIVAEVLHTYIPGGIASQDLFGIGSMLVGASAQSQGALFLWALAALIGAIIVINLFVWQRLLRYAERFKFD